MHTTAVLNKTNKVLLALLVSLNIFSSTVYAEEPESSEPSETQEIDQPEATDENNQEVNENNEENKSDSELGEVDNTCPDEIMNEYSETVFNQDDPKLLELQTQYPACEFRIVAEDNKKEEQESEYVEGNEAEYLSSSPEEAIIWTTADNEDGTLRINGYKGDVSTLHIPDQIDGKDVTAIGDNVFKNNNELEEVVMSDKIREIGNYVFAGCPNLKLVRNSDTVEKIGVLAFQDCHLLKTVNIPASLKELSMGCFKDCIALENVKLPKNLSNYPGTSTWGVYVNSYGPFDGCTNLKTVAFEEGFTRIPDKLFMGSSLESIDIPETVQEIGKSSFLLCKTLTSITLPKGLTKVGDSAFYGCESIEKIQLPDSIDELGASTFCDCKSLRVINIPTSLKELSMGCFKDCIALENVKLPKNLSNYPGTSTWGVYVNTFGPFDECTNLKTVAFEEGFTRIPDKLFMGSSLESIEIPETVQEIGKSSFLNCKSLSSIKFSDILMKIDNYAFSGCTGLEKVYLPESLREIQDEAFMNCNNLKIVRSKSIFDNNTQTENEDDSSIYSTHLPDSIITIGKNAFRGCSCIRSIHLPKSLQSLGGGAFSGTGITSVEIPKSLKTASIGAPNYYGPFGNTNISDISFEEGTSDIPSNLFYNMDSLSTITIPETVKTIGENTFKKCENLKQILIPENVNSINKNAFEKDVEIICNYDTYAVTYAIDTGKQFSKYNDTPSSSDLIDRTQTNIDVDFGGQAINGYVVETINYAVKPEMRDGLTKNNIGIYVPDNISVVNYEVDGDTTEDFVIDGKILNIPINKPEGKIKILIKALNNEDIVSYALFSAYTENPRKKITDIIGTVQGKFKGISINCPSEIGTNLLSISGTTGAGKTVDINVNGIAQLQAVSSMSGLWKADIQLENPNDGETLCIDASTTNDNGEIISVRAYTIYQGEAPVLKSVMMKYGNNEVDLLNAEKPPYIYYNPNLTTYSFEIKIDNNEDVESVYITSTKYGLTEQIEARYNPSKDAYVTTECFGGSSLYVPSDNLVIEYKKKSSPARITTELINNYKDFVNDLAAEENIPFNVVEESETSLHTNIDVSELFDGVTGAVIDADIKIIDELTDSNISEAYGIIGSYSELVQLLAEYKRVTGPDNEDYMIGMGLADPDNLIILAGKVGKSVSDIERDALAIRLSVTDVNDVNWNTLFEYQDAFSQVSTVLDLFHTANKINNTYDSYEELNRQIIQSGRSDIAELQRENRDLRDSKVAFIVLSLIITSILATPVGPAYVSVMPTAELTMGLMLGLINTLSDSFFEFRANNLKMKVAKVRWAIDPSGKVFEKNTEKPIKGAKVSIYYSDKEKGNRPKDNEYGVLWDAQEYDQDNPLLSDEFGSYKWDVPEGWWRVKAEAKGYETGWSEWLPVPPIQENVNFYLSKKEGKESLLINVGNIGENEADIVAVYPISIDKLNIRNDIKNGCAKAIAIGSNNDTEHKNIYSIVDIVEGKYKVAAYKSHYLIGVKEVEVGTEMGSESLWLRELGDANGDSEVDVADLSLVSSYILSDQKIIDDSTEASDFNEDLHIDVEDLSLISSRILSGTN